MNLDHKIQALQAIQNELTRRKEPQKAQKRENRSTTNKSDLCRILKIMSKILNLMVHKLNQLAKE